MRNGEGKTEGSINKKPPNSMRKRGGKAKDEVQSPSPRRYNKGEFVGCKGLGREKPPNLVGVLRKKTEKVFETIITSRKKVYLLLREIGPKTR